MARVSVEVSDWKRHTQWSFRYGIQPNRPEACRTIAVRSKVQRLSVARPPRTSIEVFPISNFDPPSRSDRQISIDKSDDEWFDARFGIHKTYLKGQPPIIGREVRSS